MSHNSESDEKIQDEARDKLHEFFLRRPFWERWQPVMSENQWVLLGRKDPSNHKKQLPDYCYNIFDLYGRTLFKSMVPEREVIKSHDSKKLDQCKTIAEAKQVLDIDWEKAGSVSGVWSRAMQFFEQQAGDKIEEEGMADLTEAEIEDLLRLTLGEAFLEEQCTKIQALDPGKPIYEIIENLFKKQAEQAANWGTYMGKLAYEWGPGALGGLKKGEAKGTTGFLDLNGNVKGERKLKHPQTYQLLLMAWPEIDAMLKSDPPKRMLDLWNWLAPFSYAGWIEITDLDPLVSLCQSIKLKLKKPGAPRKSKKC